MAEVVNLNRARKSANRAKKAEKATENAAKFGRSKMEKNLQQARNDKADRHLDQHRLESDD